MNDITVRFEVKITERKDMSRMIVIEERGADIKRVLSVYEGSRSFLSASMKAVLADYMKDNTPKLQTHTLPQYVQDYFGTRSIEMRREKDMGGFSFHGPKLSILVKKNHACSARTELARIIRQKLAEQKEA